MWLRANYPKRYTKMYKKWGEFKVRPLPATPAAQ